MVDLNEPDFERFPRARQALEAAVVVDLEPGDAVYYPSMWWHQVEALSPFNIMINFWWLTAPAYMGNPHGYSYACHYGSSEIAPMLKRKPGEKCLIITYLAQRKLRASICLPAVQGALASLDNDGVRSLRAMVKNKLKSLEALQRGFSNEK